VFIILEIIVTGPLTVCYNTWQFLLNNLSASSVDLDVSRYLVSYIWLVRFCFHLAKYVRQMRFVLHIFIMLLFLGVCVK